MCTFSSCPRLEDHDYYGILVVSWRAVCLSFCVVAHCIDLAGLVKRWHLIVGD